MAICVQVSRFEKSTIILAFKCLWYQHSALAPESKMKVMVCHFVSDSHEVMTALIVVLPLIVVVEISLQLHRSLAPESKMMAEFKTMSTHKAVAS